jgi:glycosyltransferase involved in cell wall biosynthesis
MRILYISQYFPPEAGATQTRAYEMARNWVRMGHQVTMLTEFPNHPSGIIPPEYRRKLYEFSSLDGIQVIRLWVKASPRKNFINRMLFYLSFMVLAFFAGAFLAKGKYTLLYASSPPLFVGGAALILSILKRIPLVFEVRDLWPETAVALGELSNPLAISLSEKLEEQCYQKSIQIIVVTQGLYDRLKKRGISEEKLFLVPNGANLDLYIYKALERDQIRNELGLSRKFILVYAGIFGLAYHLETIIESASRLVNEPDISFLLIGDGPKKAEIASMVNANHLPNLIVLPEKPRELIPGFLSAADVSVIPLRKLPILEAALPVKIFDAWACERPVLLCDNGEAKEMVTRVHGGLVIPPEDPVKMVEAILFLKQNASERLLMGKNGREFTERYHSRAALAEKLIHHLEKYTQ